MRDEDHLPVWLQPTDALDDRLIYEVIVKVVLGLVYDERGMPACEQEGQDRRALLTAGKFGCVFEIRLSGSRDVKFYADLVVGLHRFECERVNARPQRFENLLRARAAERDVLLQLVQCV